MLVLRRHWPHLSQQGYPCSHAVIRVLWVAPTAWLWLPAPVSGLCFLPPFSWKGKVPRFWHIHYTFWLHLFLGPRDFERKAIMLRQEMEGGLGVLLGCLCDCLNSAYFLLVFPFDKARSLELYESFIFVPVPKWLTGVTHAYHPFSLQKIIKIYWPSLSLLLYHSSLFSSL